MSTPAPHDPHPYRGFRDKAAHDRAHELMRLPSWHPDAPSGGMRHVLKKALSLCWRSPGYCDYEMLGTSSTSEGAAMNEDLIQHIDALVAEEHKLRSSGGGLSEDDRRRMRELEVALDQCWDLLRQRRGRRDAGENPTDATVRSERVVEEYLQ